MHGKLGSQLLLVGSEDGLLRIHLHLRVVGLHVWMRDVLTRWICLWVVEVVLLSREGSRHCECAFHCSGHQLLSRLVGQVSRRDVISDYSRMGMLSIV